jgi:hypothetical protein
MLEQTEAQVQDSRLGITTQERTTKPAPVNSLTSSQLETVPESEYNLSETEPGANDAVVGNRPPTKMPTSNPWTSSATIPESIPMSRNSSGVSTATRDSNRISRLDFQESPRTAHNFTTPKPNFQESPRPIHNVMEHVRQRILLAIRRPGNRIPPSDHSLQMVFQFDLDIPGFLREQYDDGLRQDIGRILTVTGRAKNAQLLTVVDYLIQTWSEHKLVLLDALRAALSTQAGQIGPGPSFPVIYATRFLDI